MLAFASLPFVSLTGSRVYLTPLNAYISVHHPTGVPTQVETGYKRQNKF